MNSNLIIEYIKIKYPYIIIDGDFFCIVENSKIIAFYDGKNIIKLSKKISLPKNTKVPILNYFYNSDYNNLQTLKFIQLSKLEEKIIVKKIKNILKKKEKYTYNAFYDNKSNNFIYINNKYEKYINDIIQDMNNDQELIQICKKEIMYNIDSILQNIQNYKNNVFNYFSDLDDPNMKNTKQFYKNNKKNCDFLLENLNNIYLSINSSENEDSSEKDIIKEDSSENEDSSEKDLINEYLSEKYSSENEDSSEKYSSEKYSSEKDLIKEDLISEDSSENIKEPNLLLDNISILKKEFEDLKKIYNKDNLYIILKNAYQKRCRKYILHNKDTIIKSIKDYYKKWIIWCDGGNFDNDLSFYKKDSIKNILFLQNLLKNIINKSSSFESNVLNKTILHIDSELNNLLNNQLIYLSLEENKIQDQQNIDSDKQSTINEIYKNIEDSEKNIKYRLKRVGELLYLNNATCIDTESDNYNINVMNFISLNNIFFRKQRVINELDDIIKNENIEIDDYILIEFQKIKSNLFKHVYFLNLQEIINSQFLQYHKTKTSKERIPESFYKHINNILQFWKFNILYYRNQDLDLLNIIDDIVKDVKLYVRIKPLVGITDKTLLVSTKLTEHNLFLNGKTYNDFQNVYPDDFTNLDIYIGKQDFENEYLLDNVNFLEKFDIVPNGLYNAFNKLQMGYSIVLYGKGVSGSGTSYTFFGENGTPGILQYGLANLENVSNIKLKYLFEQYVFTTNDKYIKGNLHNLINIVPQLNEYFSIDETSQFSEIIPSYINIKSLDVKDIGDLIEIIGNHRTKMNRIKELPNGKSSRSNLYYVFEINFNNAPTSYLTVIDSCSQDSPNDIYDLFINSKDMLLENLMICEKDEAIEFINKYAKNNIIKDFTPEFIYNCIQESIYNNETLNHFNYYINSKNNYYEKIKYHNFDEYKYNKSMYFVNPKTEFTHINRNNNCLTIPIMQFIENVSLKNDIKKIKYHLIYNIKRELSLLPQTTYTLYLTDFINNKKLLGSIPKIKDNLNIYKKSDTLPYNIKDTLPYNIKGTDSLNSSNLDNSDDSDNSDNLDDLNNIDNIKEDIKEYKKEDKKEDIIIQNEPNSTIKIIIEKAI
jgi:hypothetical protein